MIEERLFNGDYGRAFRSIYYRVFSVHEIAEQKILQWVFGATILSYFLTFFEWFHNHLTTVDALADGSYVCWSYFQGCEKLLVLRALPEGYSQPLLYMVLLGFLGLAVFLMYRKEWMLAHLAILPAFIWHVLGSFVVTMSMAGNYDYYLFVFAFITLFIPHKEFFLKLALVSLYTLSTVAKIHPTWIAGTYFSPLKTGLPLFQDWSIPLYTNLVIFMEMVGVWFLMSSNKLLRRGALIFFIFFHLYSGLLVGYRYPTTVLPTLLILFGPMYRPLSIPFDRRAIAGWSLIILLCCMQFTPRLIYGDEKLTMEGNRFGLYMFEANHQCISATEIEYLNGESVMGKRESHSARNRCDPYSYWFRLKKACERNPNVAHIRWTFDHSINGGPFLRIVDVPDACALEYYPFKHNDWIRTEYDNPPVIGYPVENLYE